MSSFSVVTIDGVVFAEDFNSDTGEPIYVADRPFKYGNRYVDVLDLDAFWRWVAFLSRIKSSGFKYSEIERAEWLNDAMNASISANDVWTNEKYDLVSILI